MGPGAAVTAAKASVFGRPVWPCLLHEFVGAEDQAEWVRERLRWVDYVPNDVLVGSAGRRFLDDVLAHRESAWDGYRVPAGQCGDVLA